jgi:hypothetical protein
MNFVLFKIINDLCFGSFTYIYQIMILQDVEWGKD